MSERDADGLSASDPLAGAGTSCLVASPPRRLAAHDPARAADSAPAQQGDDVVQLLSRIQQAARKQDYAGVFMYQQGEMIQSSRLVHVLDGTGERERLEILDGQPREYLRHNEDVQCLIPERKTVLIERRRGDRFPGLLLGNPANLTEHYKIRTESALHRVAGRECRLITIEPLDKLRYGYRARTSKPICC